LHAGFTTKALQDLTGGIVQVIKNNNNLGMLEKLRVSTMFGLG
jgi:hypothetical protein